MKIKTWLFGKLLKQYSISLDEIEELNIKYEKVKSQLGTYGPKLAGRMDSELDFTRVLETTKIYSTLTKCLDDYITTCVDVGIMTQGGPLEILSCWINDMKAGEYNPPHTHHNAQGLSTVLFLKVPEFINDVKDPHKFKDGQLGFIGVDGQGTNWCEPKVGDFFIFQAAHQHCVMPFKTKTEKEIRRSMSFNVVFKK